MPRLESLLVAVGTLLVVLFFAGDVLSDPTRPRTRVANSAGLQKETRIVSEGPVDAAPAASGDLGDGGGGGVGGHAPAAPAAAVADAKELLPTARRTALTVGKLTQTPHGTELIITTPNLRGGSASEVVAFSSYILDPSTNATRARAGQPLRIVHAPGIADIIDEGRRNRRERDAQLKERASAAPGEMMSHPEMGRKYNFVNDFPRDEVPLEPLGMPSLKLVPSSMSQYRHPFGTCETSAVRIANVTRRTLRDHPRAARQFDREDGFEDTRHDSLIEHERCQSVIVRMLFIFATLMDELGLGGSWFLTHGSLIGAARHGGMIPWDVDVDIAISRRAFHRLERLWPLGFPRDMFLQTYHTDPEYRLQIGNKVTGFFEQVRIADRYSSYRDYRFPPKGRLTRYYHAGPQLDLIPIYTHKLDGRRVVLNTGTNSSVLFPTKLMCFEGVLLPVPNQWKTFLDLIYGTDVWRGFPEEKFIHLNMFHASKCRATQPSTFAKWWLNMTLDKDKLREWKAAVGAKPQPSKTAAAAVIEKLVDEKKNDVWSRNDPVHCQFVRKRGKMVCLTNPFWLAKGGAQDAGAGGGGSTNAPVANTGSASTIAEALEPLSSPDNGNAKQGETN